MKQGTQRPEEARVVKTLSEREIQDKLYGGYLGRRKPPQTGAKAAPTLTVGTPPRMEESPWTGSEILASEMDRLRSELITLREEKEKLAVTLDQMNRSVSRVAPTSSASGWLGKITGLVLLMAASGYLASGRLLQASPAAGDPTPFTVQAAVYDSLVPAQLAVQYLDGMSYGAFLVQVPRKDGRVRYRICVGTFVTKDEADLERLRLVGDPRFGYFKDAFVRLR